MNIERGSNKICMRFKKQTKAKKLQNMLVVPAACGGPGRPTSRPGVSIHSARGWGLRGRGAAPARSKAHEILSRGSVVLLLLSLNLPESTFL